MYIGNLNPKYFYNCDVRGFIEMDTFPHELFGLDILDLSPPCTSFSTTGNREKDWGNLKKFAEGEMVQTLDTLFIESLKIVDRLRPKIFVAENVPGILMGASLKKVKDIYREADRIGYCLKHQLITSEKLGVPQKRKRVFFIGVRKDLIKYLDIPECEPSISNNQNNMFYQPSEWIQIKHDQPIIPYKYVESKNVNNGNISHLKVYEYWLMTEPGKSLSSAHEQGYYWNYHKTSPDHPLPTICAGSNGIYHYNEPRKLTSLELVLGSSFPIDYNFLDNNPLFAVGMSVPPIMMAHIAKAIKHQVLDKVELGILIDNLNH